MYGEARLEASKSYTNVEPSGRILDGCHAAMVCLAYWLYLIEKFGDEGVSETIVW